MALPVQDMQAEIERVRDELAEYGEARASLDQIGDRKSAKFVIKMALEEIEADKKPDLSFDAEANEFVVTAENPKVVPRDDEVEEDEVVAEVEASVAAMSEPDYDDTDTDDDEGDALPF